MKTLLLHLPLIEAFDLAPLSLTAQTVPVELKLVAGEHLFTSRPIEIGTFYHYTVFAQCSIPYSYDEALHYITLPGIDLTGDKQIAIHTSLEQHSDIQHVMKLNPHTSDPKPDNVWSHFADNSQEVKQQLSSAIKKIDEALVEQLLQSGIKGVVHITPAPIVTPLNYHDYKEMFAPYKEAVEVPSVEDLAELQGIVKSTYGGNVNSPIGNEFANVIGSTHDPRIDKKCWIDLWAEKCNKNVRPTECTSLNFKSNKNPYECSTHFVGGHVIPGQVAMEVKPGDMVFLYPICKGHNNDDHCYMRVVRNQLGIVLFNYNQILVERR